ncbi:MAG: FAD:protein FMN transferase [Clostridia bacterium]|nr:FAD:protein FMN transferase [Clostridia bacterium]
MKRVFSAFLCALLVSVCLCACSGGKTRYNVVYTDVFDTVTEFTAYCGTQEEFDKAANAMHEELLRLHKLFDIYNGYEDVENVFTMNVRTYTSLEPTAPEIVALAELGREYYELSGGKLNIALGSVLSIWHEYREKGTGIPSTEELQAAAEHTDINNVGVAGGFVYINDSKLKLDFGAIAKGYASGLAAQAVKDCGVTDFALNIGGNVVTSGEKPEGKWVIGVQDPDGGIYTKVKVSDISVVTSGDYQRYYEYEGVRYHHIIDTETLFPANLYRSVTVICKDPAQADALSTALFCMPLEQGKELAKSKGAEALWILPDKSAVRTDGFANYE